MPRLSRNINPSPPASLSPPLATQGFRQTSHPHSGLYDRPVIRKSACSEMEGSGASMYFKEKSLRQTHGILMAPHPKRLQYANERYLPNSVYCDSYSSTNFTYRLFWYFGSASSFLDRRMCRVLAHGLKPLVQRSASLMGSGSGVACEERVSSKPSLLLCQHDQRVHVGI